MNLAVPKRCIWKAYTVVGRFGSRTGAWIEQSGMQCGLLARAPAQPYLDTSFLQLRSKRWAALPAKIVEFGTPFPHFSPSSAQQRARLLCSRAEPFLKPSRASRSCLYIPSAEGFSPVNPQVVSNLIQISFISLHQVIQNRADLFYGFSPLHHHLLFSPQTNRNQEAPWYQRGKAAHTTHI